MRRPRINAYISHSVDKRLSEVTSRRGVSKASIVDAAIAAFLSPDEEDRRDAMILKRLDRIHDRLDQLERDVMITAETLALFVRYFLTVTPPVMAPSERGASGWALHHERWEAEHANYGWGDSGWHHRWHHDCDD